MNIIDQIKNASSSTEIDDIVKQYLADIDESNISESYGETAARLGGDEILEAAEARWFDLDN